MAHKTCFHELQFLTISTIFRKKIKNIAYTYYGKDTPIQIGITLFLYKILTQFLRVGYGRAFKVGEFKYAI